MKAKRILSIVLTLVILMGTFSSMRLTAYAESNTTTITSPATTGTMTITLIIKADPAAADFDVTLPTSLAYDGTAKTTSATAKSTVTGMGTITVEYYKNGTKVDSAVEIGDYTVKLNVASGTHYNAGTVENADWKFTITKEIATVTKAPTAKSLTYTDSAQELVTAGTAIGGTMQYALGKDATNAPTDGWSGDVPKGTDARTYYVWYKVVGDDNHTDSEPACVTVTIEEQKQSQNEGDDTQQNPDGTKTVTKENADGKTISVTNYSKTDEQISQFVFKKANGTKLDLKNVNSKNLKNVVVPATVKANGKTYKVTRIRKGFLKNCKQATKVDIGKNVNIIDKNAFNYGKKVKKVVIRGKLKKVGKGAFKNTKKNVIIKVQTNAKNFEKNKKLLEKSGLPKNATVKREKNKK
ncbi:leucine-rich repeat protein [Butyrivibrio sp. WCD2001]|uniref:leucine-rich repeat protein n=1 Tax=Butyrivibrio sp. WCD2001 TaxID=1280681 RepID=UPI000404CFB7|nr:leucine-rich repeat protein [Butyrivibrio sp. WCD2001]